MIYNQIVTWTAFAILAMFFLTTTLRGRLSSGTLTDRFCLFWRTGPGYHCVEMKLKLVLGERYICKNSSACCGLNFDATDLPHSSFEPLYPKLFRGTPEVDLVSTVWPSDLPKVRIKRSQVMAMGKLSPIALNFCYDSFMNNHFLLGLPVWWSGVCGLKNVQ